MNVSEDLGGTLQLYPVDHNCFCVLKQKKIKGEANNCSVLIEWNFQQNLGSVL